MHKDSFTRLKRIGPPSDPQSEDELMVFSTPEGRAGQVDHLDDHHLFAWVDELTPGGGGLQFETYPQDGQWLYLETTGSDTSPSGYGMEFYEHSGNGFNVGVSDGGNLDLSVVGGGHLSLNSTGNINIHEGNTSGFGNITVNSEFGPMYLSSKKELDIESGDYGYMHIRSDGIRIQTDLGGSSDLTLIGGRDSGMVANAGALSLVAGGADTSAIIMGANRDVAINYYMVGKGGIYSGLSNPGHYLTLPEGSIFLIASDFGGTPFLKIDNTTGTPTFHIPTGASWVADL